MLDPVLFHCPPKKAIFCQKGWSNSCRNYLKDYLSASRFDRQSVCYEINRQLCVWLISSPTIRQLEFTLKLWSTTSRDVQSNTTLTSLDYWTITVNYQLQTSLHTLHTNSSRCISLSPNPQPCYYLLSNNMGNLWLKPTSVSQWSGKGIVPVTGHLSPNFMVGDGLCELATLDTSNSTAGSDDSEKKLVYGRRRHVWTSHTLGIMDSSAGWNHGPQGTPWFADEVEMCALSQSYLMLQIVQLMEMTVESMEHRRGRGGGGGGG